MVVEKDLIIVSLVKVGLKAENYLIWEVLLLTDFKPCEVFQNTPFSKPGAACLVPFLMAFPKTKN